MATSVHYMKRVIAGKKKYIELKDVNWVTVPLFGELTPKNILEKMNLEKND